MKDNWVIYCHLNKINGSSSLRAHIATQIRGKRKPCGKHPITKEKLHWRYVDDD